MTPEELLKPRYKVIADFPDSCLIIGEVITVGEESEFMEPTEWWDRFPYLFKKLEWWEEREEKDMPEYVKYRLDARDVVCKIDRYEMKGNDSFIAYTETFNLWCIYLNSQDLPATKEEYETYINQTP